jgi:hypothetical protein
MARKRRRKVQESEVTGTKYLRKLLPLLERLHDDGCARDKAGNRRLVPTASCGSLRTYEMICSNFSGLASEEELLAHIAKLPPQPPDS